MTKYDQLQEYLINNQSKWLVTGVAGFIGSNLLEKLLILNQKVIGLDNFENGFQDNIDHAIEDANNILEEQFNELDNEDKISLSDSDESSIFSDIDDPIDIDHLKKRVLL